MGMLSQSQAIVLLEALLNALLYGSTQLIKYEGQHAATGSNQSLLAHQEL